jgi:ClpP class serine protease
MRVIDAVTSRPWAITEDWLRTIASIATRENDSIEAVEARLGRKMDNTRNVTKRDGVAIIPVSGPIFPKANLFTEVSGATSIEVLARDFTTALEDASVKSIILDIDSPGGAVSGIHEFAQMVYEARGRKPIVSYVGNMAASAAYWIASATDEIVLDETASLGSIGVVAMVPDPAKRKSADLEIVSSKSPKKRIDVGTEAGRAVIQSEVDALADIFISRVARNRAIEEDDVLGVEGGMVMGSAAIAAGLGDRLGSMEKLIAELNAPQHSFITSQPRRAAQENTMSENGIIAKIRAILTGEEQIEAKEDEVTLVAIKDAEIERLRAELEAQRAASARAAEEETQKRITAEVESTVAKFADRFGRDARGGFEALLREVKVAGLDKVESCLLAFVESLPVAISTERTTPASVDVEQIAAEAAGTLDPLAAMNAVIEAKLLADGLQRGSAEWGRAFNVEFDRMSAHGK